MKQNLKVSHTMNLGMFKFHETNRDFTKSASKNRIKRISDSMIENGLLVHPIIVTSKFVIVDGQHRVEAARVAGKGVYYIVDTTIPNTSTGIFNAAKNFNKDAKEWGKKDYIHGFAAQGKEAYKELQEFTEKFPMFTLTECMMFLENSGTKHAHKVDFANGTFDVKNVKVAEKWANQILELKPYFEKGYNKSVFVRTLITIMEKKKSFKFDEFLHKVKLRPTSIKVCGDKKSYSELIESIYNFKRREDEKLNLRF